MEIVYWTFVFLGLIIIAGGVINITLYSIKHFRDDKLLRLSNEGMAKRIEKLMGEIQLERLDYEKEIRMLKNKLASKRRF
jgi:hypothetical protein